MGCYRGLRRIMRIARFVFWLYWMGFRVSIDNAVTKALLFFSPFDREGGVHR
jgi:hypothetical protein